MGYRASGLPDRRAAGPSRAVGRGPLGLRAAGPLGRGGPWAAGLLLAKPVERMGLPFDPNFEKDKANDAVTLIIHDMVIPDPFSLKTVNNFNSSPPFGLFDIFNHLIYHSTDYDKQGFAAYKSFDDYRLFNDGYVESLLSAGAFCSIETRGSPCLRSQS